MKLPSFKSSFAVRAQVRIGIMFSVCIGVLALPPAARLGSAYAQLPAEAAAGQQFFGTPAQAAGSAVINFSELATVDAAKPLAVDSPSYGETSPNVLLPSGEPQEILVPQLLLPGPLALPFVVSPSPTSNFAGLDDIAQVGGTTFNSPPDTDGAVGLNRTLEGLNNNYRIQNKATGATISTVSIGTFWTLSGGSGFFDPKTLYDPINDRWIVVALSNRRTTNSSICIGVSQTADPSGLYNIFRVVASTGTTWADFPCVGFNRNWVAVNVNLFNIGPDTSAGARMLVVDYAQLRANTLSSVFIGSGPSFCSSPAATYSSTENTLYVPKALGDSPGSTASTYRLDTITGTPTAPVYTVGATRSRGLTYVIPTGNILPQSAPVSGTSSCGATPCALETQDSQIRSTPVVRGGNLFYSQTIGLPSGGLTHTAALWTELDASGGANTGTLVDGGRVEDSTATPSNGGKWYAYPHIAVNQFGDIILGFSQFSSAQHPSAGYTYHHHTDAAGTMRDAIIYKSGEDYNREDAGTGRNRWGDYSKAQVDPSDDTSLWVLQEYAKARVGTNDTSSTMFINDSRWGTWWAKLACTISCPANIAQKNDAGQCGAVVTYPAPTSSGPCGPVTSTPASGSFFPVGTTTVVASDVSGGSCSFTVTVNDTEPPKINCPTNVTQCNDPGQCSAVVNYIVSASDNCPGLTLVCDPPPGSLFPVGSTTVNCLATDAATNTASCSFPVIVKDCEPPVVACIPGVNPSGKKIPAAGKNPKSGQNPDGFYELLAKDNCDPNPKIFIQDSGSAFLAGPFANGDVVKITQSNHPGSQPAPAPVVAHLHVRGDALLYGMDAAGNVSGSISCLVPPPPK